MSCATDPLTDELIGRALGDFVVQAPLAAGGHAMVYVGAQRGLDRPAVIKVLHARLRDQPALVDRFLREAQLASRIDHPFAAHVYAFGAEPDGVLWLAMEQVRGTPLDALIAAQGPLPVTRFGALFDRICEVVQAVHEAGIVHRDLKPSNVVVLARGGRLVPKLLDLGIARALADPEPPVAPSGDALDEVPLRLTQRGRVLGSPPYMAPEQWLDPARVDARADVYALGVLAFECLTGRLPFTGATTEALATAHARAPVPPLGGGLPSTLDVVLQRAMAKPAAARFASVAELAAAMAAAIGAPAAPAAPRARLDDELARVVLTQLPLPLAEAVAAADAATTPAAARLAWRQVVRVGLRLIGVVALACRGQLGLERTPAGADGALRVRELARGALDDAGWLALASALCAQFATRRDAFPIPELIDLLAEHRDALAAAAALDPTTADDATLVASAAHLLDGLRFLADYPLVVPRDGRAEAWVGTRRAHRATVAGAALADGRPALVDRDGALVVTLWPLVQAVAPAPGAPPELFMLDGRGRFGARLVAFPHGFEHHDPALWSWFARDLLEAAPADEAAAGDPYRGLRSLTAADRGALLGRDLEIEQALNRLRVHALIAVVGPSGVGKSSLVQAGVLPELPPGWRHAVLRPGAAPLTALIAALGRAGVEALDLAALRAEPRTLAAALTRAAGDAGFALVIDQLEELFTLGAPADERLAFAAAIADAARRPEAPVRVLVTLRDDFLARVQDLAPLQPLVAAGLQLLTTPGPAALRRIIVEPARRHGYTFDAPDLPARMVDEVAGAPGALALLAFAASRLWELRDRDQRALTAAAYAAMGGVAGALAQHAETTLAAMAPAEQRVVRRLFRHLLDDQGARIVHDRPALLAQVGAGGEAALERLIAARLVVASEGPAGVERVEVIHEALLPAWPRLVAWQRDHAGDLHLREELRAAARAWDAHRRGRGLLWRGVALTELAVWSSRWSDPLPPLEAAFVAASRAEATRGRRARRAGLALGFAVLATVLVVVLAINRRAAHEHAAAERARAAAERNAETAARRMREMLVEDGRLAMVAGDPQRALAYLAAARAQGADGTALRYLVARALAATAGERATMPAVTGRLFAAVFSPDGATIATIGDHPGAQLWDADGAPRATLDAGGSAMTDVDIAPDGGLVVAASKAGRAYLWDAHTGAARAVLVDAGGLRVVRFSPDGRTIALGGSAPVVRLWDTATARPRLVLPHASGITTARFSPDGAWLATGTVDGAVALWSTTTGRRVATGTHAVGPVHLAFTPDGRRLVSCGGDEVVHVSEVPTGRRLVRFALDLHPQGVLAIAVSPDGAAVATAGEEGSAALWDLASGRLRATLIGHRSTVRDLRFGPGADEVTTASEDGTVKIWDATTGELLATLLGHTGTVWSVAIDRAATRILTASIDGTARLWDAQRRDHLAALPGRAASGVRALRRPDGTDALIAIDGVGQPMTWVGDAAGRVPTASPGTAPVVAVAIDRAGRRAVIADVAGARVIDVASGATVVTLAGVATPVQAVAFAPGGDRVATGSLLGVVQLWDAATGRELARRPTTPAVTIHDLAFDATGTRLAAARADATVEVTAAATGARLGTLRGGHHLGVATVRFSDDGARIVTGGRDKLACVWDATSGALLATLAGHASELTAAEFSPDGALIATASYDATARMWDATDGTLLDVVAHHPLPVLSLAFAATSDRLFTAGDDGRVRVWDVARSVPPLAELTAVVRCRVPFALAGTRLVPRARACPP